MNAASDDGQTADSSAQIYDSAAEEVAKVTVTTVQQTSGAIGVVTDMYITPKGPKSDILTITLDIWKTGRYSLSFQDSGVLDGKFFEYTYSWKDVLLNAGTFDYNVKITGNKGSLDMMSSRFSSFTTDVRVTNSAGRIVGRGWVRISLPNPPPHYWW